MLAGITQSLVGRVGRVELLPLSGVELGQERLPTSLDALLLGIRDATSIETHAARGALFETWALSELVKQSFNTGQGTGLHFWRDNVGHEVDVVFETAQGLQAIEIKSGAIFASDWPQAVSEWAALADTPTLPPQIIYGGAGHYARQDCDVWGWCEFALGC